MKCRKNFIQVNFVILVFTGLFITKPVAAIDLDAYGEKVIWSFDLPRGSALSSYDDSELLRVRVLFRDHQEIVKPYVAISIQRETISGRDSYDRTLGQYGLGLRFFESEYPVKFFVERRHSEEKGRNQARGDANNEVAATLVMSGDSMAKDDDAWKASWYADLSQVASSNSKSEQSGSAWLRFSAVSLRSGGLWIMMDPLDVMAYRECIDGCRDWYFAGVGLAINYASDRLSVALRANLGERMDTSDVGIVRYRDAARLLLTFQGEL